jgi:mono/diheme cytochrome c family protein
MKISFWAFLFSLTLLGCGTKGDGSSSTIQDIKDLKTKQYAINGKAIYDQLCANCHQSNGKGLGRLIPPLAGSDYMKEDLGRTIRIIKYGLSGEITVNGISYNQPMPPNPQLTSMEIAEITTYIFNVWGLREGLITVKEVENSLKNR